MSLNNIHQKKKKSSSQLNQPSSPALQQRHSNTRFPPPPPPAQTIPKSSPSRRRIPDERAVPLTQYPSPINHNSSIRSRLSTIISSGTALEGASPSTQSTSPLTTRSNPGVQRQNVTSRPPLPPNKKNSASAAFAWATSTTPRMRVPLTNQSGNSTGTSALEAKRASEIEEIAEKFHYNGPRQVYRGPTITTCTSLATDGSEPLKWFPFRNSTHLLKPPPPPPVIVEDILGRQQDLPQQPPNQQQSRGNPTIRSGPQQLSAEQHKCLRNLLQAARRLAPLPAQQEPWESQQSPPLLTSSPSGGPEVASSSSPSFPSNQTLSQLEQATIHHNPLQRRPSVGPFINNGIPNEIQDDLLRIECLLGLGLEKYKEAINQKIQNHNQITQLVKSTSSQLNAQQSQSQQKFLTKYPHPPYPYPHYPLQPQQQVYPAIMDINIQQSNTGNMDGGEELNITNVAKPVWSDHQTAEPFISPNFTLNTFMEPHPPEAPTKGDPNANEQNPISLLKPINFDDFQALAEQSRSGFQSSEGMQNQQNPFIAGALQYQSTPLPYHFNQIHPRGPDLSNLEPEVTKATPLVIQVTPRKESPPSQELPHPELPRKQSTVQQQYQEYLQQDENNMRDLSPNSFKILEQPVDLMPRKPVAVAKGLPRSPSNLFPTEGLTIVKASDKKPNTANTNSAPVTPPPAVARGGTKKINLDKPSPFFPGFSEKPIQMKIKSPRTRTGGSSTGGQTISVTSGARSSKLDGVEELGNLLSQLPVLSRQQKVEEFQAFSTIKPETPLTEGDSETSMIPLVSSNGTLVSDRRPNSGQRGRRRVATVSGDNSGGGGSMKVEVSEGITTDEEFSNLDTNKMSINELVSLGRKIYRILSQVQLSTNSNGQTTPSLATQQHQQVPQEPRSPNQVYTAPVTLNVPSPNTPVFTPKAKSIKTRGSANKAQGLPVSPALIVDFNSMPNPTFITGPGVNAGKNNQKLVPSSKVLGGSRTPSQQQLPPNLFRNIVKPPPTRWGDSGKRSSSSAKKKPSKGRKISRRSNSSLMSRAAGRAATSAGKLKKSRPPFQAEEMPIPKTMPTSFTVRENYNNNYTRKSSARYKKRQPTPYPYPSYMDNPSGMTINSTAGSGYRSPGRRNFIQENINKAAVMKKRHDSRVHPRNLPPVENYYRKMYGTVPSRIQGSRSRSNSIHHLHHPRRGKNQHPNQIDYLPPPPHDVMMRRANEHSTRRTGSSREYDNRYLRSSSVPATSHTAYSNSPQPSHYQQQRSLSTPRPSTGISVNMASSSNRSESPVPQHNQNPNSNQSRPSSQGILKSSTTGNAKLAKTKNGGASKVKFEKLPSKVSTVTDDNDNAAPAPPKEEASQVARKSRSKTKRTSNLVEKKAPITNNQNQNNDNNNKDSSASSAETQKEETPPPPPPQPKKKILRVKPKPNGKNTKQVTVPDNVSTDYSDNNEQSGKLQQPVFNSESDQKIIRNLVKEEIKLMVNRKVKKSMKKLKHRSRSSKKSSGGRGEEGYIKRRIDLDGEIDGGDTAGEPPFKSGLRHRRGNSPIERDDIDSGEITPVYTPPKFYDESLFSLEKWVNPDTVPPGSAYTSDNDTPGNSANIKDDNLTSVYGVVGGRVRNGKLANSSNAKPGVVRFSLPTITNHMKIKKKSK